MAAATTTTPLYGDIPDPPHRFINYVGRGFLLGASCGSAWLFTRGALSTSPAGGRLRGGIHVVRSNAPRVAGVFGACSAMYCALERAMAVARRRDDPWNSIAACAASLGLFNMRSGGRAAALNALYGAAVATVFEGADWVAGEWDSRFASHPSPTLTKNPGTLEAPAATSKSQTELHGCDGGALPWLLRSTTPSSPSPSSIISEKDLEVLELSRKLLLERIAKGFHLPAMAQSAR